MHPAAADYVNRFRSDTKLKIVDVGSLDINGSCRSMFPNASYHGIDLVDGRGVDEVADAAVWKPKSLVDMVVCCEMLEHTPVWPTVIARSYGWLRKDGRLIVTAAGPGRVPHSAVDGGPIRAGEFYQNIDPDELETAFLLAGYEDVEIEVVGSDVRGTGVNRG